MKLTKTVYWISTVIFCCIFLFSATMYFTKYEMVKGFFQSLGYPIYLIYPLATAKVLGIIAIITKKSRLLKEWAYAGFFFDAVLAAAAHFHAHQGRFQYGYASSRLLTGCDRRPRQFALG